MVDEKNTLQNTLYRGQLTVHITKNTIYMSARAGFKFRRKPHRLWDRFQFHGMTFPLVSSRVSASLCISTPNLVGVGRIRAASSRTGELSIHLSSKTFKSLKERRSREDGQIKMPIPELGFLNPGTLLSCPSTLSHQLAGGLTTSSLTGRCRRCVPCGEQSHNSRSIQQGVQCWFLALQTSLLRAVPGAELRTHHTTQPHCWLQ